MTTKITNVAEIDAEIDAAKNGTIADRARVGHDVIVALKDATGIRSLAGLRAAGGDIARLRDRCLVELLNMETLT